MKTRLDRLITTLDSIEEPVPTIVRRIPNISPFTAVHSEESKDVVISWNVNPKKQTSDYLEAILYFCNDLSSYKLQESGSRPYNVLIQTELLNEKGFIEIPLDRALRLSKKRISQLQYFYSVHAFTPYCLISLEGNKNLWTPETGKICVVSSQDLSRPLVRFMQETLDVQHTRQDLEKQLRGIYNRHT